MKKAVVLSVFVLFNYGIRAQNLVSNASFEDLISCPIGIGNISYSTGWSSYNQTPDYLNACNNNQAGVPSNLFGYQNARTGNAYCGVYTYAQTGQYREMIGIPLTQQLVIGMKYFVTFYTSRGLNPSGGVRINIATDKLGAKFSTVPYSYANPIPIDNVAQVYADSIISDTLNWVKVAGSFIADSAYQYLSIGNFFTDSATNHVAFDTTAAFAYYYIDDIYVSGDSVPNEIKENSSIHSSLKIYPNPTADWIIIEGNNINSISFYDALGNKFIEDTSINTFINKIDIGNLSKGIYFIKIHTIEKYFIKKIIKI